MTTSLLIVEYNYISGTCQPLKNHETLGVTIERHAKFLMPPWLQEI